MATLFDLAQAYLAQSLPKTFKYDGTNQPKIPTPVLPVQPIVQPIVKPINTGGGGGGGIGNISTSTKTSTGGENSTGGGITELQKQLSQGIGYDNFMNSVKDDYDKFSKSSPDFVSFDDFYQQTAPLGKNPITGVAYKQPRTISDQNNILGYTFSDPNKFTGISSLRDFLPGGKYSLTGMAANALKGINDKIQSTDFAKAKTLVDYADIKSYGGYEEREKAREKTKAEARELQKEIDAGKFGRATDQDRGRGDSGGSKTGKTGSKGKSGSKGTRGTGMSGFGAGADIGSGSKGSSKGASKGTGSRGPAGGASRSGNYGGAAKGTGAKGPAGGATNKGGGGGSSGGGGGGGGGSGCFLKGTLITMFDGTRKPVEQVDLGNEVAIGGKVFATGKFLVKNLHDL